MAKFRKFVLAITSLLLVLLLAAMAVMSTPWFRLSLERRLILALENTLGGRVEVSHFRFRPLILEGVLEGIVIHGSEPPDAPPLFSAHAVILRLSPVNLLHRQIRIMSVDWDGAEVHLRSNADGSTNLPGPVLHVNAGQVVDQIIEWRIGRATLVHSAFYWNDRPFNLDLSARDVALLLGFRRGAGYQGSLAASAVSFEFPGHSIPPLSFSTHFVLVHNELALTSMTCQARGMTLSGSFVFHPAPKPAASFAFQAVFDVPALNPVLRFPFLRTGNVRLDGQGIYGHGEVLGRGRLQARQLSFRDANFDSGPLEASADLSLERSRLAVSGLKLLGWGGSAQGEGEIGLAAKTPHFILRTRLQNVSLADLLRCSRSNPPWIADLRPASRVNGPAELSWEGQLENVRSNFDLRLDAPGAPPPGALVLSGGVRGSVLMDHGFSFSLENSTLHTPHSTLALEGMIGETPGQGQPAGRLEIQLQTSEVEEWRSLFGSALPPSSHLPLSLQEPVTFEGEITGALASPQIHGSLRLGKFDYRGSAWDSLRANLTVSGNGLQVSSGQLSRGASLLSLDGSVQLQGWRTTQASLVRLSARARRTPLEGLNSALGVDYPVAGQLSGQVDLVGAMSNLEGKGDVKVEAGEFSGETFESFSAAIQASKSTFNFTGIELLKDHGRLTGKAQIDVSTRALTCQFHGAGFSLAGFHKLALAFPNAAGSDALEAAPDALPGPSTNPLHGQASFDFQGSGAPNLFHFHSTAFVQGFGMGGVQLGDLRMEFHGEGRNIQIEGATSGAGGMFSFNGKITAAEEWPLELQGQYTSFRLDPWAALFSNKPLGAQVTATGSFQAGGPLREPSKIAAQNHIQTLEVSFPSLKWTNEHPVDVRYAAGRFSAQPFRMQGPSTNLTVGGSLRLASPASLSATLEGAADATILRLLDPSLQASGQAQINLALSGSPAAPRLNGLVKIQDVSISSPGLPLRFNSLNGEIDLEGERATVRSLRGTSGGGTLTADGFVTLALPPRFDLNVKLDQVRVHYPFEFTSILGGALRLTGTSDRAQLRGDLAVSQVLAGGSKPWLEQIMQPAAPPLLLPSGGASPLAEQVRLNLRVSSPTPVRLQVQDLRLTADIDVRLQGSLANPVTVGSVHFLNGEAVLRGNRFTLDRGDLNLSSSVRTQATLDLEAHTRVQQYDLTIDVTGPVEHLKMTYRSDPPLPTGDVFSLLALGYARQQQETSTSGLVSSFAAGNATQTVGESALLSQALSTQVGGRIQRLFGVSRIQIDPNVGLPGFNTGARVTVEQQVTRDLTLTYITNTASSQYQIIQFELAINDQMSLLGVRDPNGIVGVELRFRHRFR